MNHVTHESLLEEIKDLNAREQEEVYMFVQALKRSRVSPLAFIEEIMHFRDNVTNKKDGLYEHEMVVTNALKNRYGMLHGGITATFIDTAMGATVFKLTGTTNGAVTLDLNVNFITPATNGRLTAKTEVIKKGGTIIIMQTRVLNETNEVIATATGIFYRRKSAQGRRVKQR